MTVWPSTDISAIAATDDLHVAPFRADGTTPGTLTWIWSVVVDGRLYVRAYNGTASRWHRSAVEQGAGAMSAAGRTFDASFTRADRALDAAIDAAYEAKYAGSPYLPPMLTERTRAATMEISPRA